MRLKIEYDYRISYVKYRHQNADTAYGGAEIEVEIKELQSAEAPLVAKIGQKSDRFDKAPRNFSFKENGEPREVRYLDGRYFVELYDRRTLEENLKNGLKNTIFERNGPAILFSHNQTRVTHTTGEAIERSAKWGQPHRSVSDDKGESKGRAYSDLADQMIIVEGIVFKEIPEPILSIKADYSDNAMIVPRKHGEYAAVRYSSTNIYCESGNVYGFSYNLNQALDVFEKEGLEAPFIEIYDPSVFNYDGDNHDATHVASKIVSELQSHMSRLPRSLLKVAIEVKAAFEDAGHRVTNRLVDAIDKISSLEISDREIERIKVSAVRQPKQYHSSKSEDIYQGRLNFLEEHFGHLKAKAAAFRDRWEIRSKNDTWDILSGPISKVKVGYKEVFELNSAGQTIECCQLAGMDLKAALDVIGEGKRLIVSMPIGGGGRFAVATLDEDDLVQIVSPVDEEKADKTANEFQEFVRVTNEARLKEEQIMSFDGFKFGVEI